MRNHQQLEDFFGIGEGGAERHESMRDTMSRRISLRTKLRLLPKVLSRRERYLVVSLAVIAAIPPVVLGLIIQKHLVRGLTFGALKQ